MNAHSVSKGAWKRPYVYLSTFAILSNVIFAAFLILQFTLPTHFEVEPERETPSRGGGGTAVLLVVAFMFIGGIILSYLLTIPGAVIIIFKRRLFGTYLSLAGLVVSILVFGLLNLLNRSNPVPIAYIILAGCMSGFGLWALLKLGLK